LTIPADSGNQVHFAVSGSRPAVEFNTMPLVLLDTHFKLTKSL
jgi:hypothetical protein